MNYTDEYVERVYAGVLGKIIGVYLGRPVEGWSYERITAEIGEVDTFLQQRRGVPLIAADDDISGTFTFLRALPDHGNSIEITPRQIGHTWLNYIIPNRSILWWGGLGISTEHTAFLRLCCGIPAPQSGSMALNGPVMAEQIGAQIFIDGWAMVAPGDPELAAELARRAASVSHDGAAVHAAQVLAAMEALAFVETDRLKLVAAGLAVIPKDSIIRRLIEDIREWWAAEPDWRRARQKLDDQYGYSKFPGNCHVVPNHGLIILAFIYGDDDFRRTLTIVNTCGWDTDCNSGNLGCLMGIKNGLAGIDGSAADWRMAVADRLYLPTADSGRVITDALRETYEIVNIGRALRQWPPLLPKDVARFHFEAEGAVQGFQVASGVAGGERLQLKNVAGHSRLGRRSLAICYKGVTAEEPAAIATPVFLPPETLASKGGDTYTLMASPTLYSGQLVSWGAVAGEGNRHPVEGRLFIDTFDAQDRPTRLFAPPVVFLPGAYRQASWQVPDTAGQPITAVGLTITPPSGEAPGEAGETGDISGVIYLDYLTWSGSPRIFLGPQPGGGHMWRHMWVNAVDHWRAAGAFNMCQNEGIGLLICGSGEWVDYRATATLRSNLAKAFGLAVRVGGLRHYYALLLTDQDKVQLVRRRSDAEEAEVLEEKSFVWEKGAAYRFELAVSGSILTALVDGRPVLSTFTTLAIPDPAPLSRGGGVAFYCEEGQLSSAGIAVSPV
ncbi:MAG TPA: ADP-ribosylglycohydrolase family protein [Firmicutes bacterium]|nr:ADP-ribosylglycohydrolase family protein [Bacillota bacterium]